MGVNLDTQNFSTLQQITTATNWIKVSASCFFNLSLKAEVTIWAWGQDKFYRLGNFPAAAQQLFPIQVGSQTDWNEIEIGTKRIAFAIKADGTSSKRLNTTQISTDTDWDAVQARNYSATRALRTMEAYGTGALTTRVWQWERI